MLFVHESLIHAPAERVFAFHELPDALQRLTPEWMHVRVVQAAPDIAVGRVAIVDVPIVFGWYTRTESEHIVYDPPRLFVDTMRRGPFRRWVHRHLVIPTEGGAILRDEVDCAMPWFLGGGLADRLIVRRRLRRLFDYRHRVTREWCLVDR